MIRNGETDELNPGNIRPEGDPWTAPTAPNVEDNSDIDQELADAKAASDAGNDPGLLSPTPPVQAPAPRAQPPKSVQIPGKTVEIEGERFNKIYPYIFEIHQVNNDGTTSTKLADPDEVDGVTFNSVRHVLNLPPSSISVSLGFTNTVTATNGGVYEEHNGIVFKTITISGTTGLAPRRPTVKVPGIGKTEGLLKKFIPGAVTAFNQVADQVKTLINGSEPRKSDTFTADMYDKTGYKRIWMLHNFFVEYAEAKKQRNGRDVRLVFAVPKDNAAYVITPLSFDISKDASNPLLYRYTIAMRAWDMVTTNEAEAGYRGNYVPSKTDPTSIKGILSKIQEARSAMQSANNILRAAQSDINDAFQVINQGVLILKDAVQIDNDLADFTQTVINNATIMARNTQSQFNQEMQRTGLIASIVFKIGDLLGAGGKFEVKKDIQGISASPASKNSNPSGEQKASDNDVNQQLVAGIIKVMNTPGVPESIRLSDVSPLPPTVEAEIERQQEQALQTTSSQIYNLTDKMREVNDNLAYATGMMDETYAQVYGLPAPGTVFRTPTEDEIILSAQIDAGREGFLQTLASGDIYQDRPVDPFQASNLSLPPGDKISTPRSASPVFVDRGLTLDDLALKHLGDATRAKEIALLNSLRAPYIDEAGFTRPITQATGRAFLVSDRTNLIVNQTIKISGTGLPTSRRRILSIQDLGGNAYSITVDGAANLAQYVAGSSPFMTARTPGTVGSGDVLMIPSDSEGDITPKVRSTPLTERMTFAEKLFLVDVALDENSDIMMSQSGDVRLVYGYENAVQALRLKIETEKGELDLHLDYGLITKIGEKITGEILQEIEANVRNCVISDPRFTDATVSATISGTVLRVFIDANGANGSGRIPIEFQVTI